MPVVTQSDEDGAVNGSWMALSHNNIHPSSYPKRPGM